MQCCTNYSSLKLVGEITFNYCVLHVKKVCCNSFFVKIKRILVAVDVVVFLIFVLYDLTWFWKIFCDYVKYPFFVLLKV